MARVVTKTFRGAVKSNPCVYGSYSAIKRWRDDTLSHFDNPASISTDYFARRFTLPSALTEGRFGMKFTCTSNTGNTVRMVQLKESAGGTERLQLFRNDGFAGVYILAGGTYYYTAPKDFFTNNNSVLVPNVVEVYWLCNGTSGIVKVWLNGILIIEVNPVNIGTAGIQYAIFGGYSTYPVAADIEWIIINDADSADEELSFLKFARVRPSGAASYGDPGVAITGRYITGPWAGFTYDDYVVANSNSLYICASGTSAACPHAAAAAALIKQWYKAFTNLEIRQWLIDHAIDL